MLLDLKLPKVDGIEVLRAIRQNPELRTLPVVVLTSSREERDLVETYDLGVNSYLVKPIDFDKFVDTVQHARPLLGAAERAAAQGAGASALRP